MREQKLVIRWAGKKYILKCHWTKKRDKERERERLKANDRMKLFAQDVKRMEYSLSLHISVWTRENSFEAQKRITYTRAHSHTYIWTLKHHDQNEYTLAHTSSWFCKCKLTEKKHTPKQQIYTRLSLYYSWQQKKIVGIEKDRNQVKMNANKCALHSNSANQPIWKSGRERQRETQREATTRETTKK